MLQTVSLLLIGFYQKFISPYKGFSCAYRLSTNGLSCSGYGKKVIEKHGFFIGYKLLQRRFYDCKWHSEHLPKKQVLNPHGAYLGSKIHSQRGFVDCDCGGCDLPDLPSCDAADCLPDTSGCDLPCHPFKSLTADSEPLCCDAADFCGNFLPFEITKKEDFKEKRNNKNMLMKENKLPSKVSLEKSNGVSLEKNPED